MADNLFFFFHFHRHQLYPDLPDMPKPEPKENQELENLFLRVAGSDQEIDWIELKRILDYSMKDGKSFFKENSMA